MTLIAQNLYKIYQNGLKETRAVDGISLEIKKGMSVAIIGPSGAGKSTLLHLLGGLDNPTSGKVVLDDTDIYKLPDRERAKIRNIRMGFVFQFYHLLPEFTALENVMLPVLIRGFRLRSSARNLRWSFGGQVRLRRCGFLLRSSSFGGQVGGQAGIRNQAEGVLRLVGLENRTSHRPSELSGGESQRVAIARAIVNGPEILLCDEPTGNLDSKTSGLIYDLLFSLQSKTNMALVVVTHDERISKEADETIHIKDGKIIHPS